MSTRKQHVLHAAKLHIFDSERGTPEGHQPCAVLRDRVFVPSSQYFVHALHAPQSSMMQFAALLTSFGAAHKPRLQAFCSASTGHAAPPLVALSKMDRVRSLAPVLQVAVHCPHSLHCETKQSTTGALVALTAAVVVVVAAAVISGAVEVVVTGVEVQVIQSRTSSVAAQWTPPFRCAVITLRTRRSLQVFGSHACQADHSLSAQSMGQAWELHDPTSDNTGHGAPSFISRTIMLRMRLRDPELQLWLHCPQLPQSETWQSLLHGC